MQVIGENTFSIPTTSFAISASNSGYDLQYSVDGNSWTSYSDSVPANEVTIVNFSVKGLMFRLSGNTDTLYVQY